jgi:hypothetical protein
MSLGHHLEHMVPILLIWETSSTVCWPSVQKGQDNDRSSFLT